MNKRTSTIPGWWLVTQKELIDLWQNGRAMTFLILLSILLGVTSFLLATNSELKLLPPREMVFMILQISMSISLFICMLIAADSISGERERATLEGLLLVPTGRRHLVLGKFLAALSIWPAAFLIAAAHLVILSPNILILSQGLLWGGLLGSLLVVGFTAFGLLVSLATDSNRTSLFVTLFVAVLFLIPTQFPGTAQTGFMGKLVKRINPMESVNQFLEKILVNNRTFEEMASWLAAPIVLALVAGVVLFLFAAPRLDLTGDKMKFWRLKRSSVVSLLLLVGLLATSPVIIHAQTAVPETVLQIEISTAAQQLKTGDSFDFTTTVTNHNSTMSGPLVVAMNLVNLGDGDPVDPEDWSPERTQAIEPLAAGESAELTWTINAILEGNYLAYMVVIPEPDTAETTSLPVASQGIHLTVRQFSPLNPGGVAPVAFGTPLFLGILLGLQQWRRRRKIDPGNIPIIARV
jgi:ABC-2 type transport system permease protein